VIKTAVTPALFWQQLGELVPRGWWSDADDIIARANKRRKYARFNTGSISRTSAVALRALVAWRQPRRIAEVGTFIGVSTESMAFTDAVIVTCDASNDCLPDTKRRACWPYKTSTQMLRQACLSLAAGKVAGPFQFFFFDGLLSHEDCALILKLSARDAVYVFDDYNGEFKGIQNVRKLRPLLPNHVLMPADGWVRDDTTLAVLVPESLL
jgi:predicted O-methyltransferase YrrM